MQQYIVLITKFLEGTISLEEKYKLKLWIEKKENNLHFFKDYIKHYDHHTERFFDEGTAYQKFLTTIAQKEKKTRSLRLVNVYKYAALFISLFSIGYLAKVYTDKKNTVPVASVSDTNPEQQNSQILITLADGSTRAINANINNTVTDDNGAVIATKSNDALRFTADKASGTDLAYNEIFIPNGETFKIKLSDGTTVWLNAGSKLRFPQRFSDGALMRTVFLEGEAFFDVSENKEKPFVVNTNGMAVKVLGTKFNVSSYNTDSTITTTLVEGAVQVYQAAIPDKGLQLRPGFQASYNKTSNAFKEKKVDTERYTGWMNNKLLINNMRFSEILKKLERSHNVILINEAQHLNDEVYTGEFDGESIEIILKTIALSTPFHYKMNGNVITIRK